MFTVLFYETATGNKVVKDWLRSFAKEDRTVLGEDLKTVQIGFPMGLPLCRALGNGLWEVRSTLPVKRAEARMIFYQDSDAGALVVVHGFIKKAQKTPKRDIDIALRRKRETSP
ncbi:type II toxin-antitoxin system RelE/ParE family toxin [Caulobacter sp. BE254]|uniref:type II toxin-antitoxin system RelE/ParE family toxin n=1 Tax=Caulobacter sp. BE254 TaxID=2817720 RepID=UPI002858982F|nr:type II toxin-antitoxin system RelE/ParE family toxin [Caulobacter sp. BE254]MDR7116867.1 phage-related protein [Caulobacter sp. BE254]